MSNDKMRAEFEAWAAQQLGGSFRRYDDGCYRDCDIESAWLGWAASRAALAIELPEKISQYNTNDAGFVDPAAAEHDEAIDDCRAAIEAAGVRVKE